MGIPKKITPGHRKVSFFIIVGLVLGSFFALYFLKYLPANKEELNKRGFRILRQISNNISEKNKEYKVRINKIIKSPSTKERLLINAISKKFKDEEEIKKILSSKFLHINELTLKPVKTINNFRTEYPEIGDSVYETTISLIKDEVWKQQYQTRCLTDSDAISIFMEGDLNKYLTTIINSRKDLFESYMIIKDVQDDIDTGSIKKYKSKETLIYASGNVAITHGSTFDSLILNKGGLHSAGIHTVQLSEVPYILFLQPMSWDHNNLILLGLVKKSDYDSKYLSVSSGLIYSVCIILLLLICSLPFVKITLITSKEKLMVKDIVMAGVTLILGTAIIVTVLTDWFLFRAIEEKNRKLLNNLTDSVYKDFENEIKKAYNQLKDYDLTAVNDKKWLLGKSTDSGDSLFIPPNHYKTFDQVFWVNGNGMQQAKWEMNGKSSPLLDLKDRNYIRSILDGEAYVYPFENDNDTFFIEPVYSNISGELKILMSVKSNAPQATDSLLKTYPRLNIDSLLKAYSLSKNPSGFKIDSLLKIDSLRKSDSLLNGYKVVALGTRMYTEPTPLIPREFGFCIIDEAGKVLIHSDIKRSLLENLIEETNNNLALEQAIKKREEKFIEDIIYYGDPHELRIKPIRNLPIYLVTYYNKNNILNTNSRIVAFSLFLTVTLLAFLLMTHRIFQIGNQKFSKLNFPPGQYEWFKPQQSSSNELIHISRFILSYVTLGVVYNLIDCLTIESSFLWVLLFNMLVMPFYTYWGIHIIKRTLTEQRNRKASKYLPFFLLMTLLNLLILNYTQSDYIKDTEITKYYLHVLLFQVISVIFIRIFSLYFIKQGYPKHEENHLKPAWSIRLSNYSRSVVLLLLVISVMPPVTFLYYAYNEEKLQSVKTRQLQLARDLQIRNKQILARHHKLKKYKETVYKKIYNDYIDTIINRKNIFTGDHIKSGSGLQKRKDLLRPLNNLSLYENLLSVIPKVESLQDSSYHLKNAANDSTWYWAWNFGSHYKSISLIYNGIGEQKLPLIIDSGMPMYLKGIIGVRNFAILFSLVVIGVLYAVFRLIRQMAKTIFLIGYKEAFETCAVQEVFIEKFAPYIKMEKILIIDNKYYFQKNIEQHNGYCDIIDINPSNDLDKSIEVIRKSDKKIIILSNCCETLEKKLHEEYDRAFDNDEWKAVFILKPAKLKNGVKFPDELKNMTNIDAWREKAMGAMSGYFELTSKNQYAKWLHESLRRIENYDGNNSLHTGRDRDDLILNTQHQFEDIYEALWKACSDQEKFVLYDFAQDEFANYRNEYIINELIRKGLLIYENDSLHIMTYSFRNFILTKSGAPELADVQTGINKSEKWDVFRITLLIAVVSVALFVFFTQEEVFKQISAALASLVALTTMLFKFLEQSKPAVKAV